MEKEVLDPITLFQQQVSTIYLEGLDDFRQIVNSTQEYKKNLDKQKFRFYESSKIVEAQELNLNYSSNTNTNFLIDDELKGANDVLLKYRSIAENNSEIYKYEVQKYNKLIAENEDKYNRIVNVLQNNEESRIFFIKTSIEKFMKIYEGSIVAGFDLINVHF